MTSNAPRAAPLPVVEFDPVADQAAYDRLPPRLRAAYDALPVRSVATRALDLLAQGYTEDQLLTTLKETAEQFGLDLDREIEKDRRPPRRRNR